MMRRCFVQSSHQTRQVQHMAGAGSPGRDTGWMNWERDQGGSPGRDTGRESREGVQGEVQGRSPWRKSGGRGGHRENPGPGKGEFREEYMVGVQRGIQGE